MRGTNQRAGAVLETPAGVTQEVSAPMCSQSTPTDSLCSIDGCTNPVLRYGVCVMHYQRWKRHGSYDDPRPTFEQRFWSKVNKTGSCWNWTGMRFRLGYGAIRRDRKMVSAHRVSWELHHGTIPGNLHVLHRCDNRSCVNPDHLFLGTHDDNMRDKVTKGRGAASLTAEQVVEIRQRYRAGDVTQRELARTFNVDPSNISYIVSGKSWSHLESGV